MESPVVPQTTDEPKNMTELDFQLLCKAYGKEYALKVMRIVNGMRLTRKMRAVQI
ncbi:MAG: hypothetical protein US57_C0024G0003 [Candidatus Moranbacteria bacterium GW2011_GWC2_37_73]|nr:MAG: hypothetical protein UR95_C0004G0092 [Parcubacteria group bacterium GW2011_GWC1_36_108]KKQ38993.1 MAG: hypothetical protein US57_C0024G0003 [Candidatus Moranbacteria bacterium GW2011_GWC2_37_73]